jgi:acyl-CoA thioesterase-1
LHKGIYPASTKKNLESIINLITGGDRKIYIAKFYTEEIARAIANEFGLSNYGLQTIFITQYDDMFQEFSKLDNVEIIEGIWSGVWGLNMSDVVHPDAEGYRIMAENYYKEMEPYLKANGLVKE